MKQIAATLVCLFVLVSPGYAQQTRTLGWDASPEEARVTEYHIERDGVVAGIVPVTVHRFTFTINPGETTTFVLRSFGWKIDSLTGILLEEAGLGDPAPPFTYTEPIPVPPPLVVSQDSSTCNQYGVGCPLVDAGLNTWVITSPSWAILRNGEHYDNGYSDWLLWYGGSIYAYRSDLNRWWINVGFWSEFPYDPRNPPAPPAPTLKTCVWTDGVIYTEGQVSPPYSIVQKNWSRWFATMQLQGWTGNTQVPSKNKYVGTLYCVGR